MSFIRFLRSFSVQQEGEEGEEEEEGFSSSVLHFALWDIQLRSHHTAFSLPRNSPWRRDWQQKQQPVTHDAFPDADSRRPPFHEWTLPNWGCF